MEEAIAEFRARKAQEAAKLSAELAGRKKEEMKRKAAILEAGMEPFLQFHYAY